MIMDAEKAAILYVDDEKANLDVFMSAFRRYYHVLTATSGADAIEILRQQEVAVIITDQRMPDMTGVEFLQLIISDYPEPVRMLLTGYSDADAVIKAINEGHVFRYITKPWDETELKQTLDLGVKIYQLEKKNRAYINQMHREAVKKEHIIKLFHKFMVNQPGNDVQIKDDNNLFAGEKKNICILVVAINYLNKLGETTPPEKLINYLNDYYTCMFECVEAHKGIVDKFIGDKVLAIFGAPFSDLNNEKNAVSCALNMLEKLKQFNEKHSVVMGGDARLSIGIDAGDAVIGNIGFEQHISYTSIGDVFDTAACILEVSRNFLDTILISDTVYQSVKANMIVDFVAQTAAPGRAEAISIYKVICSLLGKK
jgi:class 3 adenylate cyclase/CheY-like chemotaxis protein